MTSNWLTYNPLSSFSSNFKPFFKPTVPTSPDGFLNVPSVLRAQYSMTDADKGASTGRKQAVTGFLKQTFSESSLQAFYKLLCNGTLPCGQDKNASKVVCKGYVKLPYHVKIIL